MEAMMATLLGLPRSTSPSRVALESLHIVRRVTPPQANIWSSPTVSGAKPLGLFQPSA
jgi:hypothetical protein